MSGARRSRRGTAAPLDVAATASFLLDFLAQVDGPVGLSMLCPCHVAGTLNGEAPYSGLDVLVESLYALQLREEVEFRRGEKAATLRRDSIARAVTTRRCPEFGTDADTGDAGDAADVRITPVGGRTWESEHRPDWLLYVDVRGGPGAVFDLRASRHDVLDDVLARLPSAGFDIDSRTVRRIPPQPFAPFSWHESLALHRVRFRAEFMEDADELQAIESVCPQWCGRWSRMARRRGTARAD